MSILQLLINNFTIITTLMVTFFIMLSVLIYIIGRTINIYKYGYPPKKDPIKRIMDKIKREWSYETSDGRIFTGKSAREKAKEHQKKLNFRKDIKGIIPETRKISNLSKSNEHGDEETDEDILNVIKEALAKGIICKDERGGCDNWSYDNGKKPFDCGGNPKPHISYAFRLGEDDVGYSETSYCEKCTIKMLK